MPRDKKCLCESLNIGLYYQLRELNSLTSFISQQGTQNVFGVQSLNGSPQECLIKRSAGDQCV